MGRSVQRVGDEGMKPRNPGFTISPRNVVFVDSIPRHVAKVIIVDKAGKHWETTDVRQARKWLDGPGFDMIDLLLHRSDYQTRRGTLWGWRKEASRFFRVAPATIDRAMKHISSNR